MSDYLIRELEALPNVEIRPRVQVVGGTGSDFLETVTVRDLDTGAETVEEAVLFVLIGSEPRTDWLRRRPRPRPVGIPAHRHAAHGGRRRARLAAGAAARAAGDQHRPASSRPATSGPAR